MNLVRHSADAEAAHWARWPAASDLAGHRAREKRERRLQRSAVRLLLDVPLHLITVEKIAACLECKRSTVERAFTGHEDFGEAVLSSLIADVMADIVGYRSRNGASMHESIEGFATLVARTYASPRYHALLYIIVRDGRHYGWVRELHHRNVRMRIHAKLGELARRAGARMGVFITVGDDAGDRLHSQLEQVLAMNAIGPGAEIVPAGMIDALTKSVVSQAIAATRGADTASAA